MEELQTDVSKETSSSDHITPEVARFQRVLAEDHTNEIGNLKNKDGLFTKTYGETIFPDRLCV